ncbi:thioredoxin domain-containing protein [Cnuibacter sp. UC19_7]|uniref:thioredoxin domain-containing protein n=1 Tax=Cnuibacter sp. UC19_7 TaxID=3350166 RepID=UPI00366FB74D
MAGRLADAISPYLRSHASNPVDWYPWGSEAFDVARERDVPVLVSIGYATCHWCHVMARESFSDPALAAYLNERFVAIKVDREEHPDVDAVHLAAAGAFTRDLGWPLNVFVTPAGAAFYAGTYWPPVPVQGRPSFRQVLDAVTEAWTQRRSDVDTIASELAAALSSAGEAFAPGGDELPEVDLGAAVSALAAVEDTAHGGFGTEPKFPVAPVLRFLLRSEGAGVDLSLRTLRAMAASPLRDAVEGGFFRYATRTDWSDPHYERMLYDNAVLLDAYMSAAARTGESWAADAALGIAGFLLDVLRVEGGVFASAQDSESIVDGTRTEGGYYALSAADRARQDPPALDRKVLTGWNGLAIGALAHTGLALERPDFVSAAAETADWLLAHHVGADGMLVRASLGGSVSTAVATLEDHGMFAEGLVRLACVTGSARYAGFARRLVDGVIDAGLSAPGTGDPVLAARGVAVSPDPSEGAYPSGRSATASAALTLYDLTGDARYRAAAVALVAPLAAPAVGQPIAFGALLDVVARLQGAHEQVVVVVPDAAAPDAGASDAGASVSTSSGGVLGVARTLDRATVVVASESQATELAAAGFSLLESRSTMEGRPTAYRCLDFVCRLPVTSAEALRAQLA